MVKGCVRDGTTLERNPYDYLRRGCVFYSCLEKHGGNLFSLVGNLTKLCV